MALCQLYYTDYTHQHESGNDMDPILVPRHPIPWEAEVRPGDEAKKHQQQLLQGGQLATIYPSKVCKG